MRADHSCAPAVLTRICVGALLSFGVAPMVMAQAHDERLATEASGERPASTTGLAVSAPAATSSAQTLQLASADMGGQVQQLAKVEDFNADFLSGQKIDLSRYARGNPLLPGSYRVDLSLNGQMQGRTDVSVKARDGQRDGLVCVTQELLQRIDVDFDKLGKDAAAALAANHCNAIGDVIPGATLNLDTSEMTLDVSVPQALLRRTPRGYVNPALWDSGITAGMLGYNFNAYSTRTTGSRTYNSAYLGLNSGFNVGGWYFRHNGSMSWQPGSNHYQVQDAYAQHDLNKIGVRGRLTVGLSNTTGSVFDTVPFIGAQIATDDNMLPDSLRGYAPVIRGIAQTNARVTVRQNGILLYDTPVAPGPFEIDDLYPTGYGGNLDVTVTEADGTQHTFAVPYASVPNLLRPHQWHFGGTAGVAHYPGISHNPGFFQATAEHGFTNAVTGYGGVQANDSYAAALAGLALGTPYGAFAADVTYARTRAGSQSLVGQSFRLSYSKYIQSTGSNVSVAAYRFSSQGFLDFATAVATTDAVRRGLSTDSIRRPRNRLSLTFSQTLGRRWGQISLSGYSQDYWNQSNKDVQFQLAYSNTWRALSYSLSVNRVRNGTGRMENQFMGMLTLPLGKTSHAPRMSLNVASSGSNGTTTQATVSGVAGATDQLTYGVTGAYAGASGASASLNGQYRSPYTSMQATYNQGRDYRGGSLGLSGTVVGYGGGVAFSPYTGNNTIGIVEAPAAAGAKITGYPGISVDHFGHGVVPYLTPYRLNEVAIDPKGLPDDIELDNTSQQVAPRMGAIVLMKYKTAQGRALMLDSRLSNGEMLPFGAEVIDAVSGDSVGVVGQAGQTFVRVQDASHALQVKWGDDEMSACRIDLSQLPDRSGVAASGIEHYSTTCALPGSTPRSVASRRDAKPVAPVPAS